MSGSRVTDRDRGLAALRDRLRAANLAVKVGVLQGAGSYGSQGGQAPLTIAEVAAANEFGTEKIPSRPAMRNAVDDNQPRIERLLRRAIEAVIDGRMPLETALGRVGADVQSMVRQSIVDLDDPPNAPLTIARKGSSNPLIDTGQYRQSITWAFLRGSEIDEARQSGRSR